MNDSTTDGTEPGNDEYIVCEIDGVAVEDLQGYLSDEYGDDPELVREHYPEQYDELFGSTDESSTATDAASDSETSEPQDDDDIFADPDERSTDEASTGVDDGGSSSGLTDSGSPSGTGSASETSAGRADSGVDTIGSGSRTNGASDGSSTGQATDATDVNAAAAAGNDPGMANKWYLIGIGGAGNRVVDTVLMRKEALQNTSNPRSDLWDHALTGYTLLNNNISDLSETFYAEELKEFGDRKLVQNCAIGFSHDDGLDGSGKDWTKGREYMKTDLDADDNLLSPSGRWEITEDRLLRSQAIMIAHSVTGGTGCGAAPELARHFNDELSTNKRVFGTIVLPSEEEDGDGPQAVMNGTVGTARMAKHADAIIPFENSRLKQVEEILVDVPNADRHRRDKINSALVTFLEIFSMAAIGEQGIEGDDFDLSDSLNPINWRRPKESEYGYDPAAVLAPVISKSEAGEMSKSTLEMLVRSALHNNRLSDFDPTTAWGGSFVFYGPEERLDEDVISSSFSDIMLDERNLDGNDVDHPLGVEINDYIIHVEDLDKVYLWGVLWNPMIDSLKEMYDDAKEYKDLNFRGAEAVNENWDSVEALFSMLGRENMGGSGS